MEPRSYGPSPGSKWSRHISLQRLMEKRVPLYPLFTKSVVPNFLQKGSIFPWDFNISEPHSVQPNVYLFIKFSRYAHFAFWQLCQSAHQKSCSNSYCHFLMPYIEYLSMFPPALRGITFPRDLSIWFILSKFWSLIWLINSTDFLLCD